MAPETPPSSAAAAAAAKKKKQKTNPLPLNPNWSQLQQHLNSGRRRHPKPSPAADSKTLEPPSSLGKRKDPPAAADAAAVLAPTSADCSVTEELAMDCEMVGVSSQGNKSALGRVSLVNTWGNVVYDEYVRPMDRVVDFRTHISGIQPKNLKKAKDFMAVQKEVSELIKGRILVGHALHNDLKVLLLGHPKKDIRDTSGYPPLFREGRKRALKDLAADILGIKIQQKEHCPVQDAQAVMLIYKKYKKEWEKSIKKQVSSRKLKKRPRKKKSTTDTI